MKLSINLILYIQKNGTEEVQLILHQNGKKKEFYKEIEQIDLFQRVFF